MATARSISIFLFIVLSCAFSAGSFADTAVWQSFMQAGELSVGRGELEAAAKSYKEALIQINKEPKLSSSPEIEKLMQDIQSWDEAYGKVIKTRAEVARSESEARLKTRPNADFKKMMAEMQATLEKDSAINKAHMQLMEKTADVREKIYGKDDKIAADYRRSIKLGKDMGVPGYTDDMLSMMRKSKTPTQLVQAMMTPKPQDVFESAFENPVSIAKNLRGGGYIWMGYDIWISFYSSTTPLLKKAQEYKEVAANSAADYFIKTCPGDRKVLTETGSLQCRQKEGHCLLSNKKKKLYWYHAWGGE